MARPKGSPKLGGRQKGTPNQVTAAVKDALQIAFSEVGGVDYLVGVARDDPRTFCAMLGKLIPMDVRATVKGRLIVTVDAGS